MRRPPLYLYLLHQKIAASALHNLELGATVEHLQGALQLLLLLQGCASYGFRVEGAVLG